MKKLAKKILSQRNKADRLGERIAGLQEDARVLRHAREENQDTLVEAVLAEGNRSGIFIFGDMGVIVDVDLPPGMQVWTASID